MKTGVWSHSLAPMWLLCITARCQNYSTRVEEEPTLQEHHARSPWRGVHWLSWVNVTMRRSWLGLLSVFCLRRRLQAALISCSDHGYYHNRARLSLQCLPRTWTSQWGCVLQSSGDNNWNKSWWRWHLDMCSSTRAMGKYGQDTDVHPWQPSATSDKLKI